MNALEDLLDGNAGAAPREEWAELYARYGEEFGPEATAIGPPEAFAVGA